MPMFLARRKPDHVTRPYFFNRTAFALHPAKARRYNQGLTERMSMPSSAGAWFEGDASPTNACRFGASTSGSIRTLPVK